MKPKPFSLRDRVDEVKTAERFEVGVSDVRATIKALEEERGDITISVTKRKAQLTEYLRHVYDQLAKSWQFEDMAHMLATFHTEVVARGIANPEKFAKDATRVGSDIARIVYPKETASIKRRLPPGESKEQILERLVARLHQAPTTTKHIEATSETSFPPQTEEASQQTDEIGSLSEPLDDV
jgi:acetylornithine deacetylase/succinyl-diaminopimelate desuccinylase-like protein